MSVVLAQKKKIRQSVGSKAGLYHVAANTGRTPHDGETDFEFETVNGDWESWISRLAEVNKVLAAVSDRVDHNWGVVFDRHCETG